MQLYKLFPTGKENYCKCIFFLLTHAFGKDGLNEFEGLHYYGRIHVFVKSQSYPTNNCVTY